jgi:Mannose-6-phosphate isomerase
MGYAFGSIDELGDGFGFRKVRRALGVSAFGVNAVVYPPHYEGFHHYHDTQDELYFVHSGTARVEVGDEVRELGPGGLVHVESTTPRRLSNAGDEPLVMLWSAARTATSTATGTWSTRPTSSGARRSASPPSRESRARLR